MNNNSSNQREIPTQTNVHRIESDSNISSGGTSGKKKQK